MLILTALSVGYSQTVLNRNDTLNICENYIRLSAFYKTKALNLEEKFNTESKKNNYLLIQNNYYEQKIIKLEEKYKIKEKNFEVKLENEKDNSRYRYWSGLKTGGTVTAILAAVLVILIK